MALKPNTDNGLQRRTDRTPAANMRLASCGVKCLNSSAVFQLGFSAGLTVLCSDIPHERQAQKRYASLEKTKMKRQILILIGALIIIIISCNKKDNIQLADEEIWKLGWRMIASSMDENYSVANLQFDTL